MNVPTIGILFRFIHWIIAFVVLLNLWILEEGKIVHRYLGYFAVSCVVIRLILGLKKNVNHYNPNAKYVYYLIWLSVLALGGTGFLIGLDRFWGHKLLKEIHEFFSYSILFLTVIHLMGVFLDAYKNKRKTWLVMINGKRD